MNWSPRLTRRGWLALGAVMLVIAALFLLVRRSEPALEDIQRATERGEVAASRSERIEKSLEEIARNLRSGSELTERSDEIEELTTEQRRSLETLVDLLQAQLDTIERGSEFVEETEESTETLLRLSGEQAEKLEESVFVLRDLRDFARLAGARSADLARSALYGARLAEDSQRAFER
jgi:hypothetical protein